MAFVTGLFLIDAPASALNNRGAIPNERDENTTGVKAISTKEGSYPYVSAQAYRYWLRTTLETRIPSWQKAPIFKEDKIAYTDGNPLRWWDDDLFGYMRAQSTKESAKTKRSTDTSRQGETETLETISRITPFRVGALVSLAPVSLTHDFGTMTRHEGYPIIHEHQFYRATLKGTFSLDLAASGTFSYRHKSGFLNLDDVRVQEAKSLPDVEQFETEKVFRLSPEKRLERIRALFQGMALLEGGAKQSIHYTDVTPAFVLLAVTRGGNHIFNFVVKANRLGQPILNTLALTETLTVNKDQLLTPVYIGWTQGYLDEEREKLETLLADTASPVSQHVHVCHPRIAFDHLLAHFDDIDASTRWLF